MNSDSDIRSGTGSWWPVKTSHLSKRPSLFLSKRPSVIGQNVPVSQNIPPTKTSHIHGQNIPYVRMVIQNVPIKNVIGQNVVSGHPVIES